MTGSPVFSVNLINRKNPAKPNYHVSIKKSQAIQKYVIDLKNSVWFTLDPEDETMPVKVFKTLNDRQSYILSKLRLTFLNRHMIVWFSWIFSIL